MLFPEGMPRDRAVLEAYIRWWRNDHESASAFVESIGISNIEPWLAPALESYAMPLSWKQPELAMKWASLILDDERREVISVSIAKRWYLNDQQAAETWLRTSLEEDG